MSNTLKEILAERKKLIEMEKRSNILEDIRKLKEELGVERKRISLRKKIKLCNDRYPIITEIKPKSPSKGRIMEIKEEDVKEIAEKMKRGGAIGISVLTEPKFFGGSYRNLVYAKLSKLPILMKDFVIDKYQLDIANEISDSVLLIVSALKERLGEFLDYADDLNLEPLVEVHNEEELDLALDFGAKLIGINSRDLKTLKIDLNTIKRLAPLIPKKVVKVGESGIYKKEELVEMFNYVDGYLIGSSIMESDDIERKVKELSSKE
ncbi:Indole-3-glycerol-phosphate synthase [Methanocaldococcus infernus ME]|uniref:Indole-3-glycerol phosphate synthase n=1 Tax=Methanocaldococcus infernus (strain DSM 11812 / JCM 15783 / ME) TaxID=573063 RepID=D5VR58_METIM|nr:indole-3-glycerol-phosphate synthase [Methanocaldococcus infernus]ADG13061.1 Indole-3-glycerol-phosphate synthase [Methanocaldococcus infernus ME]